MSHVRIAYVLGTTGGGTGAHVAMLARGCAERGMTVRVFGPGSTGRRFFAAENGGGTRDGSRLGRGRFVPVEIADRLRPSRDLAAVLRLRALLRRWSPDVVHAHGLRAGALAALALAPPLGRARSVLVVTVHNAPPAGGVSRAIYGLLERVVCRRADAVTWVSGDLAERLRRRGGRDGGRAMVPAPPSSAASQEEIAAARDRLGAVGPVVLGAGRLAEQKGFGVLLTAASRWQDRVPVPLVVIAGEGPLAGELAEQARAARVNVRFLGRRTDIATLLAAADVVVVPSVWEGQPLVVQEALRVGTPLVAVRAGGIPDLTGEDGAILVPPRDASALGGAVLAVLDDPGTAARLSTAARERAAALPTVQDAVDAATALYLRLTASCRRG